MSRSTFGAAKPLPGQPGFRRDESAALEAQTQQMEERLATLRNQMSREKELRDQGAGKVGGARWRSARQDRGSVRNYAKDVNERAKAREAASFADQADAAISAMVDMLLLKWAAAA